MNFNLQHTIEQFAISNELKEIGHKIVRSERLSQDDALLLYTQAPLEFLSMLAQWVKEQKFGKSVFFNKNIHVEPSNVCVHKCKFCSYYREEGDEESWGFSVDEIAESLSKIPTGSITEVHIVGGCNPHRKFNYYTKLLTCIKHVLPQVLIKAFTAVEIEHMAQLNQMSVREVLSQLKACGLVAMPGGGAEIFDEQLREQICPSKTKTADWLNIHREAHLLGIETNATILYGHLETYEQRIDHLNRLRTLQDETHGFNAFIPLKYRKENNVLGIAEETTIDEDLKNYAVTRLFLDNVPHLKAYWPMLGKEYSKLALNYGVDDFDGTINDSTKIYSMAGAEETKPTMSQAEMIHLIRSAGQTPVERDTLYNVIQTF